MTRTPPARLDPRRPLVLDTRELGRRPGSLRRVRTTVPAPADLATEVIGVPLGAPVELDLRLESVMEGVLVSGTAVAPLEGECGRCLEPVHDTVEVELQELYVYPSERREREEPDSDDEEVRPLVEDHLDLEPALRDAVVLELPLTPLCTPDCAGLCVGCGVRLADAEPGHSHTQADPRWAALESLYQEKES